MFIRSLIIQIFRNSHISCGNHLDTIYNSVSLIHTLHLSDQKAWAPKHADKQDIVNILIYRTNYEPKESPQSALASSGVVSGYSGQPENTSTTWEDIQGEEDIQGGEDVQG